MPLSILSNKLCPLYFLLLVDLFTAHVTDHPDILVAGMGILSIAPFPLPLEASTRGIVGSGSSTQAKP